MDCVALLQVFQIDKAPAQDAPLSVEPVRKGSELSERINALITDLRGGRAVYPQCFVVRQGKSNTPSAVAVVHFQTSAQRAQGMSHELCEDVVSVL